MTTATIAPAAFTREAYEDAMNHHWAILTEMRSVESRYRAEVERLTTEFATRVAELQTEEVEQWDKVVQPAMLAFVNGRRQ